MLVAVLEQRNPAFIALALAGVLLSALYMARMVFLTFAGSTRSAEAQNAHESPALMTVPLVLLAILAITLGIVAIDWGDMYHGFAYWLTMGHEKFHIVPWLTVASLALAVGGIAAGWYIYGRTPMPRRAATYSTETHTTATWAATSSPEGRDTPHDRIARRFAPIHRLLLNKYHIDDLYQWVIDRIALAFSRFVALFDRAVVNDRAVDGSALAVYLTGWWLRLTQTGRLHNYGAAMAAGAVVIALAWWLALVCNEPYWRQPSSTEIAFTPFNALNG